MKISAKADHACLAVLEQALRSRQPEPAHLADIAQPAGILERFLVQILQQVWNELNEQERGLQPTRKPEIAWAEAHATYIV